MKQTIFVLTLVSAAIATRPMAAQGVSVSPAMVMLEGQVGQSTTQTLTVTNSSDRALAFDMVAEDVVVRDGKRVWVRAGELPGSIAATAVFSQPSVVVAPGQSKQVDIHVTIPPRPAARAIVALFKGSTKFRAGAASVTASLGVILTFSITKDILMKTTPLVVQPPTASHNLTVSQQWVNSGSEPIAPKAVVAIVNAAGRLVGRVPVAAHRMLPGERADVRSEYAGDLAPGRYRALMTYDLGGKIVTSTADFSVR